MQNGLSGDPHNSEHSEWVKVSQDSAARGNIGGLVRHDGSMFTCFVADILVRSFYNDFFLMPCHTGPTHSGTP